MFRHKVSCCCCLLTLAAIGLAVSQAAADVIIDFEDYAPSGDFILLPPPYTEDGYLMSTSIKGNAGVFDSAWQGGQMPGNDTDFFAFSDQTTVTLTTGKDSGTLFNVESLLVGPFVTEIADVTATGFFGDLSVESITFSSLTTATTQTLNWNDLTRVEFTSSKGTFGGLDDIVINNIPEPSSLMVLGLMSAALLRTRRRS